MALIEVHIHSEEAKLDRLMALLAQTHQLLSRIGDTMATQQDIDALNQQAQKIMGEVQNAANALRQQIEDLQRQIDEGNQLDLEPLRATLNLLDELNPDSTPEQPEDPTNPETPAQ